MQVMAGMPVVNKINNMKQQQYLTIDGASGEGGGQIFRSALTLSMCLGKPICIDNIRAGRSKPGLLRQHLTCLQAATVISDAEVEGDYLGSSRVVFAPGDIKAGRYCFAVGSAGSTTLIFQTIMMPLLLADAPSEVVFEGGTHNGMAPTFDFIQHSFLPIMALMGCDIDVALEKYGFYPAGGGRWQATIKPITTINAVSLDQYTDKPELHAAVLLSKVPEHVALRELACIAKAYSLEESALSFKSVASAGPGNVVSLRANMGTHLAIFDAFGVKNTRAEQVASQAVVAYRQFAQAGVSVCEYLADQLIVPMVLGAGGDFTTTKPSLHLLTNIRVIEQIAGVDVFIEPMGELTYRISVKRQCR